MRQITNKKIVQKNTELKIFDIKSKLSRLGSSEIFYITIKQNFKVNFGKLFLSIK